MIDLLLYFWYLGLNHHATILSHMFHLLEAGKIVAPLYDPAHHPGVSSNHVCLYDLYHSIVGLVILFCCKSTMFYIFFSFLLSSLSPLMISSLGIRSTVCVESSETGFSSFKRVSFIINIFFSFVLLSGRRTDKVIVCVILVINYVFWWKVSSR